MTDQQHPITPPPELYNQWRAKARSQDYCSITEYVAACAAEWGYDQRGEVNEAKLQQARDQELEACRMEIIDGPGLLYIDETHDRVCLADDLRAARRPKPLSLKEQAIATLEDANLDAVHYNTILRALEELPNG